MSDGDYCRFCGAPDLLQRIDELQEQVATLQAENDKLRKSADRHIRLIGVQEVALGELRAQVDRMPVLVGYVDDATIDALTNNDDVAIYVFQESSDVFRNTIYIDPPEQG